MGNGALAGLVAITAPCAYVEPWAAVTIGVIAGLIVPPLVLGVEKLKIDDPVGALPVHGMAGIWGTLACGLFTDANRAEALGVGGAGLLVGGGGHQLWVQFYGICATIAFTFTLSLIVFLAIKYTIGLRVSEEDELRGLDISEHGMFGYPERFIDVPGAESEDIGPAPGPPSSTGAAPATNPATAS